LGSPAGREDHRPLRTSPLLSPEALFRYQIVSAVQARTLSGQRMDAAVRAVAAQTHRTPAGESTTVSVRSIHRWLAEQDRDEPAGPEPVSPAPVISRALPTARLDFLAAEKAEDRCQAFDHRGFRGSLPARDATSGTAPSVGEGATENAPHDRGNGYNNLSGSDRVRWEIADVGLDGLARRSDWKELAATLGGRGLRYRAVDLLEQFTMIHRGDSDC